jgi:DNA-binding LacI/PurR family transcriptional regulator
MYRIIKHGIVDGTYRMGTPLPKIYSFMQEHGYSRLTVSRALRRCAQEKLAHKARNRWYAGPQPLRAVSASVASHNTPVVLFLVQNPQAYYNDFNESFTSRFIMLFLDEILRCGIQAAPALRSKDPREVLMIPTGISEVKAMVRSLGGRYRGTLIMCIFPVVEKIDEWISMLLAFDKPVVWFDYAGAGAAFTRMSVSPGKRYYRLYQDEDVAVRCALNALARQGHRTIGVHAAELSDWTKRRTEQIHRQAAVFSPSLRIAVAVDPAEECWQFVRSPSRGVLYSPDPLQFGFAAGPGVPALSAASTAGVLTRQAPSLTRLIREHGPTALIALNDIMAREYYYWFTALGIDIPRDCSLVSFDNIPASMLLPVSTVDFGFERLGYLAAHIMIGDLPISANRFGNLPGVCSLINRGSIGRPGDPRRIRRLLSS